MARHLNPVNADPNRAVKALDRSRQGGKSRLRRREPDMLAAIPAPRSRKRHRRNDEPYDEERYEKYASGVCVFRKQARNRDESRAKAK